jgi:pimeloyl-ACP methyl ester carboxylesterase
MIGYISSGIVDALLSPRTRALDPEAVALVLECLRTMKRPALANAMHSISLDRPDLTPRLAAVRCPTLFVTGTDHEAWTAQQAEAKCRLLADGSVAVVPDTAYLTPLEAPEETVRVIRDHWAAPHA